VIPPGRIDSPDKVHQRSLVGSLYIGGQQNPLRYVPRRKGLLCRPERVNGAAVDRSSLEPRVRLPALHRYGPQAVAGIKHLNDGLDVPHLLSQVRVQLLVFKYLAAQLSVQPL
jgi:hypothetical protein